MEIKLERPKNGGWYYVMKTETIRTIYKSLASDVEGAIENIKDYKRPVAPEKLFVDKITKTEYETIEITLK